MVHKIKILKFISLFLLVFILVISAMSINKNVETNLLRTILPEKISNSTEIIPIADKSASIIKVVFEADDDTNCEKLKNKFLEQIDTNYFEITNPDVSKLIEQYLTEPTNFLSINTRELLKTKNYEEVYSNSIERLYNPIGIQLASMDKDPYLLFDDFIMSNKKISNISHNIDDKYYDFLTIKMKNKEGLSPDLSNKKVSEIVKLQKELSDGNSKIYLAGSPIHSYFTSKKAAADINIICILSTLLIISLTYYYFKNIKILLPIILSITFGMLSGYVAAKLWFDSFQIITMVFSTTLIGIGIDYSYHYFFAEKRDKEFIKNLSLSLITTIVPFTLLYFTGIELLKQISVFTTFGLGAIYLFILIFYSCFNFSKPIKSISTNKKYYKIALLILCILSTIGFTRLKFNDSLTALYTPTGELLHAEKLYNQVSGGELQNTQIITVNGKNIADILTKEEKITDKLDQKYIDYMALSKFVPSKSRQKENFELVKILYNTNLIRYSDILSDEQISNLKQKTFTPVNFDISNYSYLSEFMLNSNTSLIFAFTNEKLDIHENFSNTFNIKNDIEKYMHKYRLSLVKIFPVIIFAILIILIMLYGPKKGFKMLIPPVLGIVASAGLTCLVWGELNLFSIISLFLVLGFTIDYSIFRANGDKNVEDAVLISSLTTSVSFLLLSFAGFKLLSSISLILFFGILISYITGKILFRV